MKTPTSKLENRRVAWGAVMVYSSILTYLLLTPQPLRIFGILGRDVEQVVNRVFAGYAQHATAYALLACLIAWASRSMTGFPRIGFVLIAVGHGLATEWLQGFVPLRQCDWVDALANTLGFGLGWLVALFLFRSRCNHIVRTTLSSPETGMDVLE